MTGNITWDVVLTMAAVVAAAFAVWWRIESRVDRAKQDAYKKSDAANLKAEAAASLASTARGELAEYKTHVAETYVSKAGHRESTEQIMGAINSVKSAVEGTNQRIDRMFDDRAPNRRSS